MSKPFTSHAPLVAASALLCSCQTQPLAATYYKHIDASDKSVAMPLDSVGNPKKLDQFKACLRAGGWRVVVAGVTQGNGKTRHINGAAKYTLMGEGVSADNNPNDFLAFGLIGLLAGWDSAFVNFTLVENATGEEVMRLKGKERAWQPCKTVEEMNKHAEPR